MKHRFLGLAVVVCLIHAPNIAEACGVIVPVDGETASLDAQRVTMAYFPEETRTRVMAQIGYEGDLSNFSWIIPLPNEPTEVQAVDEAGASIFADLDLLTAPEFALNDWTCALNGGGGGSPVSSPGVEVLDSGNTGTFEYVVLTGDNGAIVTDWLNENGYGLPEGMESAIGAYIDQGSVFLSMKVNLEALELGKIDPAIRFDYQGGPGYPLRILQPGAADEVEIILNVLAPQAGEMRNEVILTDIPWENEEPQYLDAIRRAGNWVVEHRGVLESGYADTGDGQFELVEPPRELMEQVLGIPMEDEVVLSRFHGIFKPAQLTTDTGVTFGEEIPDVSYYFELDVTRSGVDCGFGDNGNNGSTGGGQKAEGGCATGTGGASAPLLLLFGLWVARRRLKRR